MSLSPRLVVLLSISAITFVLFLFVAIILPSAKDEQEQMEHSRQATPITDKKSGRKLQTVPPLQKQQVSEKNENNNNDNPVEEFFNSALKGHPLSNCPQQGKDVKFYSENDLFKHNTAQDLWIVVHGFVLNVSSFVSHHPGGVTMIMKGATTAMDEKSGMPKVSDVAELFTVYHQPGTVSLFDTFCIGRFRSGGKE